MIALWSLWPGIASAGCDEVADGGLATGPGVAGLLDGDLGRAHRVCGRNEIAITGGGRATIDTPNFYGHLVGGLTVDGSAMVSDRVEVYGALEAVRYDSVISALSASTLGLGHTVVGASWRVRDVDAAFGTPGLALNGKVVLPTAFGLYGNSWPVGVDLGLAGLHGTGPWSTHWQLGLLASGGFGPGPLQPQLGLAPTLGIQWRPGDLFAAVAEVATTFGYTAAVDHVAASVGARVSDGKRWGLQLGGTVPVLGRERALGTVDLRTSIRLGPID